jgi:hypothetical protein
MTRNDCVSHGLEYYDVKFKNEDSKPSVQPLLESCHSEVRECDSPNSSELFGPIWDNIDSNDGVTESRERACEPVCGSALDNFTSEHVIILS